MTKPDDIPQDVWDAAAECFVAGDWPLWLVDDERIAAHVSIARAIMAEREACAQSVQALATRHRTHQADAMKMDEAELHLMHALFVAKLDEAAAAIRNRGAAA